MAQRRHYQGIVRRDAGHHPVRRGQQASDLSGDAGTAAGTGASPPGTKLARLPCRRILRQFNPGFQPSIDERQVWSWPAGPFWPRPATYCCRGRPAWARPARRGPGHRSGYGAYSVRACDLMEDLRRARTEHNLDRRMRLYPASKLLVVDEFGIRPYDRDSTLPPLSSP